MPCKLESYAARWLSANVRFGKKLLISHRKPLQLLKIIIIVVMLVIAIPISFITTILIHPFWRWFERVSGIESFGHSGLSEWCYWFDYMVIIVIGVSLFIYIGKRKAVNP